MAHAFAGAVTGTDQDVIVVRLPWLKNDLRQAIGGAELAVEPVEVVADLALSVAECQDAAKAFVVKGSLALLRGAVHLSLCGVTRCSSASYIAEHPRN